MSDNKPSGNLLLSRSITDIYGLKARSSEKFKGFPHFKDPNDFRIRPPRKRHKHDMTPHDTQNMSDETSHDTSELVKDIALTGSRTLVDSQDNEKVNHLIKSRKLWFRALLKAEQPNILSQEKPRSTSVKRKKRIISPQTDASKLALNNFWAKAGFVQITPKDT